MNEENQDHLAAEKSTCFLISLKFYFSNFIEFLRLPIVPLDISYYYLLRPLARHFPATVPPDYISRPCLSLVEPLVIFLELSYQDRK